MTEYVRVYHKKKFSSSWTEITSYLVRQGNCRKGRGGSRIKSGNVYLDNSLPVVIEAHDSIRLMVDDGSETRIFEGLFVQPVDGDRETQWRFEGYERYATIRKADNVYLDKTDIEVFQLLVDEYFPEYTYDATSIPPDATLLARDQRLVSQLISDVFDLIAQRIDRIWFVDDDKKIWLIEESYTATGLEISDSVAQSIPLIYKDTDNWRTKVRVEGETTEFTDQKQFVVSDTGIKVYTLTKAYDRLEVKQIPSGSTEADVAPLNGALEGEDVDLSLVDYTYNLDTKTITLTDNITLTLNDTINAKGFLTSQIVGEAINPTAYSLYGLVEGAPYVNRLIKTDSEAESIAQEIVDMTGFPPRYSSVIVSWNSNYLPGNKVTLTAQSNDLPIHISEFLCDFGERAPVFTISGSSISKTLNDSFSSYERRLRQLEEKTILYLSLVKKGFYYPVSVASEVYRMIIKDDGITNSFRLDYVDGSGMLDNGSRYLDGNDGGGSLRDDGYQAVWNVNNKIKIHVVDEEADIWDTGTTTATIDTSANTITFTGAQTARTKTIHYLPSTTVTGLVLNKFGRSTNTVTVYGRLGDGTTWGSWEALPDASIVTLATSGTHVQLRIDGTSTTFYSSDARGVNIGLEVFVINE